MARIVLGAAVATAIPSVASLTGDYFPALDRTRVYGLILCGELVGTGIGFLPAGELASWTFWRVAFWVLAVPAGAVADLGGRDDHGDGAAAGPFGRLGTGFAR